MSTLSKTLKNIVIYLGLIVTIGGATLGVLNWSRISNIINNGSSNNDSSNQNVPHNPIPKDTYYIYEDDDPILSSDDDESWNVIHDQSDNWLPSSENIYERYPYLHDLEFYSDIRIDEGKAQVTKQLAANVAFKIIRSMNIIGGKLYWAHQWEESNSIVFTFKWISPSNVAYVKSYKVYLENNV